MADERNGLLIAFEGIDGAGKTTQVELLVNALQQAGHDVVRSREPTDGPWGEKIKQSAAHGRLPLDEEIEAFIEDRKEHVAQVIAPALASGKTVILDRYFYSTIAYQGARGADVKELTRRNHAIAPIPDVVLLLDIDPAAGLDRVSQLRGDIPNLFEREESLTVARQIFLQLSKDDDRIRVIDGRGSIEEVHRTICDALPASANN